MTTTSEPQDRSACHGAAGAVAPAPAAASGLHAAHECAAIAQDLERLKALIADAGDTLLTSFNEVGAALPALAGPAALARVEHAVASAVRALQFQDMANQLTTHAQTRLTALEDCLRALPAGEAGGFARARALEQPRQPVGQLAISAGSVELF